MASADMKTFKQQGCIATWDPLVCRQQGSEKAEARNTFTAAAVGTWRWPESCSQPWSIRHRGQGCSGVNRSQFIAALGPERNEDAKWGEKAQGCP